MIVGSESEWCVRVEHHVYQHTYFSELSLYDVRLNKRIGLQQSICLQQSIGLQ